MAMYLNPISSARAPHDIDDQDSHCQQSFQGRTASHESCLACHQLRISRSSLLASLVCDPLAAGTGHPLYLLSIYMRSGLPTSLFYISHFDSLSFNLQTISHIHLTYTYLHLTYTANLSYTMSRMSAFREWITRRKSSLWSASQASKSTVNGNRRTVYPETADSLRSRGQTPSKTPHCETCTCHTSTTNTHSDLDYLAYDFRGDPYGQAGIREQAKRTASAYVELCVGTAPTLAKPSQNSRITLVV
jgi:hypothetical protein